jgi:hypothetical protein
MRTVAARRATENSPLPVRGLDHRSMERTQAMWKTVREELREVVWLVWAIAGLSALGMVVVASSAAVLG